MSTKALVAESLTGQPPNNPSRLVDRCMTSPRILLAAWGLMAIIVLGLSGLLLVAWLTVTIGSPWYLVPAWTGVMLLVLLHDQICRWVVAKLSAAEVARQAIGAAVGWLLAWQMWLALFAAGDHRPLTALACGVGTIWLPLIVGSRRIGLSPPFGKPVQALLMAAGIALPAAVSLEGLNGDGDILFGRRRYSVAQAVVHATAPDIDHSAEKDDNPADGAAVFPQLLGPNRDGMLPGVTFRDWQPNPPTVLWRRPIGAGWSGIVGDLERWFTMEQRGDDEALTCGDTFTGRELWSISYPAKLAGSAGGTGPRATPLLANGHVYALGATGVLSCVAATSGELLWRTNILEDSNAENLEHGVTGSPLLTNGLLIVAPSGSKGACLSAYDPTNGDRYWSALGEPSAYSSPALVEIDGTRQICLFHATGLAGFNLAGDQLWSFPFGAKADNAAQPLFHAGAPRRVLLSTGHGHGCVALDFSANADGLWGAVEVWRKPLLKTKFSTAVQRDGFVYGLDDGILECLDLRTGTLQWKSGRYGHGQLLAAGDRLLVLDEQGILRLVAMDPAGRRELGEIPVLDGKTWNHFAVLGKLVLARNGEHVAAVRLP